MTDEIKEIIKAHLSIELTEEYARAYSSQRLLRVKLIWMGPSNSSHDLERTVISEDSVYIPGGG